MLIQAGQPLTCLEGFLDGPPAACHLTKDGQRDRAGPVAAVEGQFMVRRLRRISNESRPGLPASISTNAQS